MSSSATKPRLNAVFKQLMSIHWWMAMFYLILLITGRIIAGIEGEVSYRELCFDAHKSFGVLVLILLGWRIYLLIRVWGRKYAKHLPKLTGNWCFTTALHTTLYLLMLVVPLSGYWLSNAYQTHNVSLFGLPMPDLFPVDGAAAGRASAAHSMTAKVFVIGIGIHMICQHKVVKANGRRFLSWVKKWMPQS